MDPGSHDLIISATEINHHHGAGILLQRYFPDSANLVTLRSLTVYRGEESFGIGHHELKSAHLTVTETEARLKEILAPYRIRRILCVPYCREDFIHGLLAQKLTNAPLCTYIMDDQNIFSAKVPDYWVDRLLRASDLCFGISPELCAAYQHKYNCKFHLLPPLVEHSVPLMPCYWRPDASAPLKVAMIGNVWTADRFRQLCALLRKTGMHVDWYGSGPAATWLPGTPEEWEANNIYCLGYLPEEDLIASLASYPCVLVPSGSLDQDDDNLSFSRLSLPSRLIFLHTRTDTPVLLLGSSDSAAGRFILNLGTGLCSAYQPEDLLRQMARLEDQTEHDKLRQAIRRWAPNLVLPNAGQWIWESLERRSPPPATFQAAFSTRADDEAWLQAVPGPKPAPVRHLPAAQDRLSDEDLKTFAFLRTTHLPLLLAETESPPSPDTIELTQMLEKLTGHLIERLLPDGGDLLVLGTRIPSWATCLPANINRWRFRDSEEWQQAGFTADTGHLVSLTGNESFTDTTANFDAICSSTWLDQVKMPEALTSLSNYLSTHTRPGGINLHALTAILHPDRFWTAPAHAHLRAVFQIKDWPDLDELLTAPDLFWMSEGAYAKHWQPSAGKSYRDFGKPLGLVLFWRNEAVTPSAPHES